MNALFRKELRQVLPAQVFLAILFAIAGASLLDPHAVLAPYDEDQAWLHVVVACFTLAEGLVLGFGQFAAEEWQGTEAYLVHRGTGRRGAFHAKALAAVVSLLLLVVIPPTAFGAIHLSEHPYAGSASIGRLVQLMAAGCTAFAGYGLGALVSQIDRAFPVRALLAIAGSIALLVPHLIGVFPRGPNAPASMARHLTVQFIVTCVLLWSARHGFGGGRVSSRPLARTTEWARAALALGLFVTPFALAPFVVLPFLLEKIQDREPEIVADAAGELYVATPTERDRGELGRTHPEIYRYGKVYDIVDRHGKPVETKLAVQYTGSFRIEQPFHGVFAPHMVGSRKLGEEHPFEEWQGVAQAFVFDGPWVERRFDDVTWCFDRTSGEHWVRRHETDFPRIIDVPEPDWRRLDVRTPGAQVVRAVSRLGNTSVVLLTHDGRFLALDGTRSGGEPMLVEVPLPENDRFVGRDPMIDVQRARVGLQGYGSRDLVRGERDRYVWNGTGWLAWGDRDGIDRMGIVAADEAPELQRWIVDVAPTDGLGYRLEVRDAGTGETRLDLEVSAATPAQRRVAEAIGLLLPPIVAVTSWISPMREPPRRFWFSAGLDEIELLRGRRRTWIPLAVMGLAALLVRDLARRLHRGGAPIELRLLWCGATVLLGLPAYVLCRLIEPRAARVPRAAMPIERREPRFMIRTA